MIKEFTNIILRIISKKHTTKQLFFRILGVAILAVEILAKLKFWQSREFVAIAILTTGMLAVGILSATP